MHDRAAPRLLQTELFSDHFLFGHRLDFWRYFDCSASPGSQEASRHDRLLVQRGTKVSSEYITLLGSNSFFNSRLSIMDCLTHGGN